MAPDYRLLPEVSGKEILEDMDDFWHWIHSPRFAEIIKDASDGYIIPDLEKLLVVGESAGKCFVVKSNMTNKGSDSSIRRLSGYTTSTQLPIKNPCCHRSLSSY